MAVLSLKKNDFLITTGKKPTLIPSLAYLAVLVELLGPSQHNLETTLYNLQGATLRTSEGYIDLRIGKKGTINNEGHFLLKAEVGSKSDLSGVNITDHNDDGGQIINQSTGIITKTGSEEAQINVQFNNFGVTNIEKGVLKLTKYGHSIDATYLVRENARLLFRSYGDGYHFSNTVINNQGTLTFDRNLFHVHDGFSLNGIIKWSDSNYSSTRFQGEGEVLNRGIFTIKDGVEFRIDLNFSNRNHLLITENIALGKTLSNAENSKLSFSGGKRISINELSNNTSSKLLNEGLIELINNTQVKVQVRSNFDNSLVSLKSGSLTLAGGGSFVNTHFSIAESSTLSFSGEDGYINGHINRLKNTIFENNGQIFFTKGRNSHDIAAIASSNIELRGEVFWEGGTLASSDSGLFTMNGNSTINNKGIVKIKSTMITEGDSPFIFNGNTKLYSSGELTGETGYSNQGIFQFIGGKITNSKFFNKRKAFLSNYKEILLINSTLFNEEPAVLKITNGRIKTTSFSQTHIVDNKGTIIAQQGQIEGDLINRNTLSVEQGRLFVNELFTQYSGNLILTKNGHLQSGETINIKGGAVTGEGVISAPYNSVNFDAATISAGMAEGDIGQLTIRAEKFTETDQTHHIFELEDFDKFDQLVIKPINDYTSQGGVAHLTGRYEIRVSDKLRNQLQPGQTFEIFKFKKATFDNGIQLENPDISENLRFETRISEDSLKLIVVSHNSQPPLLLGGDTDQSHRNTLSKDSLLEGGLDNNVLTNAAREMLASDERSSRDRFFLATPTEGIDTITDFTVADDVMELAANGFNLVGELDTSEFSLGSTASTDDHSVIYLLPEIHPVSIADGMNFGATV